MRVLLRRRQRRTPETQVIGRSEAATSEASLPSKGRHPPPLRTVGASVHRAPRDVLLPSATYQQSTILPMIIGTISVPAHSSEAARHERAITSIATAENASLEEIRGLFVEEFSRLEKGATIRKYLHTLAAANVRAKVREAARLRR